MSRLLAALFLLACVSGSFAEDNKPDYHVSDDQSHDLYIHSAFAHGVRHGYEEGYHAADMDIHTGTPRKVTGGDLSHIPKTVGYRNQFGDKKSFRRGYEYGYIAGYDDSFANRKFHYPTISPDAAAMVSSGGDFDKGVASGYSAVFHSNSADFPCDRNAPVYCAGYQAGASMALSERHPPQSQVAAGAAPR